MAESLVRLTREELYELVWRKPLSRLAEEYEVSDVGLAKMCRRISIPRPPEGHWRRIRLGKDVGLPTPLPAADSNFPEVVELRRAGGGRHRDPERPYAKVLIEAIQQPDVRLVDVFRPAGAQ